MDSQPATGRTCKSARRAPVTARPAQALVRKQRRAAEKSGPEISPFIVRTSRARRSIVHQVPAGGRRCWIGELWVDLANYAR
jgi:hypothetical protein